LFPSGFQHDKLTGPEIKNEHPGFPQYNILSVEVPALAHDPI